MSDERDYSLKPPEKHPIKLPEGTLPAPESAPAPVPAAVPAVAPPEVVDEMEQESLETMKKLTGDAHS